MSDRALQLINYNVAATMPSGGGGGGGSTPIEGGNLVDVSVTEGKGKPVAGVTMPTDGVGLTGWLSGIYKASTVSQKTHKVTLQEITSAASPLDIPAGATEIAMANIGTANATVKSADMAAAAVLYPVSGGGMTVTWRANAGGTLPAVTVTVPVGAIMQVSIID